MYLSRHQEMCNHHCNLHPSIVTSLSADRCLLGAIQRIAHVAAAVEGDQLFGFSIEVELLRDSAAQPVLEKHAARIQVEEVVIDQQQMAHASIDFRHRPFDLLPLLLLPDAVLLTLHRGAEIPPQGKQARAPEQHPQHQCDLWKALDDYAATSAKSLRCIVVASRYTARLMWFVKEVEPVMRRSKTLDKLKYAIKHSMVWKAWSPGMTNQGELLVSTQVVSWFLDVPSRPEESERRQIVARLVLRIRS